MTTLILQGSQISSNWSNHLINTKKFNILWYHGHLWAMHSLGPFKSNEIILQDFLFLCLLQGWAGPDFQYRQTRHVPRAAALKGQHSHQKKRKLWKTNFIHLLHSHLTLLQYRLIWCQNDGNFISFLPVLLLAFYK